MKLKGVEYIKANSASVQNCCFKNCFGYKKTHGTAILCDSANKIVLSYVDSLNCSNKNDEEKVYGPPFNISATKLDCKYVNTTGTKSYLAGGMTYKDFESGTIKYHSITNCLCNNMLSFCRFSSNTEIAFFNIESNTLFKDNFDDIKKEFFNGAQPEGALNHLFQNAGFIWFQSMSKVDNIPFSVSNFYFHYNQFDSSAKYAHFANNYASDQMTLKDCYTDNSYPEHFYEGNVCNTVGLHIAEKESYTTYDFPDQQKVCEAFIIPSDSDFFTKSELFSKSESFSTSNDFTLSVSFTTSDSFSPSTSFTNSVSFSQSTSFTNSVSFSQSTFFTNSVSFSISDLFSNSISFTPKVVTSDSSSSQSASGSDTNLVESDSNKGFSSVFTPISPEDEQTSKSRNNSTVIIIAVVLSLLIVAIIIVVIFVILKKKKQKENRHTSADESHEMESTVVTYSNNALNQNNKDDDDPFGLELNDGHNSNNDPFKQFIEENQ